MKGYNLFGTVEEIQLAYLLALVAPYFLILIV